MRHFLLLDCSSTDLSLKSFTPSKPQTCPKAFQQLEGIYLDGKNVFSIAGPNDTYGGLGSCQQVFIGCKQQGEGGWKQSKLWGTENGMKMGKERVFYCFMAQIPKHPSRWDELIKNSPYSLDKAFESRGCSFGLLGRAIRLHCSVLWFCRGSVGWTGIPLPLGDERSNLIRYSQEQIKCSTSALSFLMVGSSDCF